MTHIATATLQTVWDCRWSRPGYRLSCVDEREQPESVFVCVRRGTRRPVTNEECETCRHWEPMETGAR
jgi:hypothetical protein